MLLAEMPEASLAVTVTLAGPAGTPAVFTVTMTGWLVPALNTTDGGLNVHGGLPEALAGRITQEKVTAPAYWDDLAVRVVTGRGSKPGLVAMGFKGI